MIRKGTQVKWKRGSGVTEGTVIEQDDDTRIVMLESEAERADR